MVVTGVADRIPERITHLVYEDAFLPQDGESCWSEEMIERYLAPDGWGVMRVGGESRAPEDPLLRFSNHPAGTLREPVRLTVPLEQRDFTRTYVKAGGNPRPPLDKQTGQFWEAAARVSADAAWK